MLISRRAYSALLRETVDAHTEILTQQAEAEPEARPELPWDWSRHAERVLTELRRIDQLMVDNYAPPISDRWWQTLERFLRSDRSQLVLRKGRRVGASTIVFPRLAVAFMLASEHPVTKGELLLTACVSVKKTEARRRLRNCKAVLDVLGIEYVSRAEEIEIPSLRRSIQVLASSGRTEVGHTIELLWCDEVSRWWSDEAGANPAHEVLAALRPALATIAGSRVFLISSALGDADYHAQQFELGDTEFQLVDRFTTWEANPCLSEKQTHRLEPDEKTWLREYGAVPSEGITDNWFGAAVDRAFVDEEPPPIARGVRPIFGIDAAFAQDRFGWAVVSTRPGPPNPATHLPQRMTWVHASGAWKPDREPSAMAHRLKAEVCAVHEPEPVDMSTVYADQHEGHSFRELARAAKLSLVILPWTGGNGDESKLQRFRAVRIAMLEGRLKLKLDPELRREFRMVRGVITPAGNERIEIPRNAKGHGDRVTAIVLAASVALCSTPTAPIEEPKKTTIEEEMQRLRDEAARKNKPKNRWAP